MVGSYTGRAEEWERRTLSGRWECRLNGFFSPRSLGFCFTKYTPYAHDLPAKIQVDARGHLHGLPDAWALQPGVRLDQRPLLSSALRHSVLRLCSAERKRELNAWAGPRITV